MNYKQFFLAASVACSALVGCEISEIKRAENEFFYPISFEADTTYFRHEGCIERRFSNNNYYSVDRGSSSKERFKQYVYYFNDFGYREDNVLCLFCWGDDCDPFRPTAACVCDIKSVHVVCENDFDANHPAGANVDDILTISLESAYPYIKNGYKGYNSQRQNEFPLNSIDPDYLKLNGMWFGQLRVKKKPANQGTYTFTVSVELDADPVTGRKPNMAPQTFKINF